MSKPRVGNVGFILMLVFQAFLAVIATLFIIFGGVELAFGRLPVGVALMAGAVAGIAMYVTLLLGLKLKCFSRFKEKLSIAGRLDFSWPQIIVVSVFAGIAEELLFRGVIQTWVEGHTNIYIGILVASVVFGLGHFSSFTYFFMASLIGVVLGAAYYLSQSIVFVVVWHIVADIVALGIFVKYPNIWSSERPAT